MVSRIHRLPSSPSEVIGTGNQMKVTDFSGFEHCWKHLGLKKNTQLPKLYKKGFVILDILMLKCLFTFKRLPRRTWTSVPKFTSVHPNNYNFQRGSSPRWTLTRLQSWQDSSLRHREYLWKLKPCSGRWDFSVWTKVAAQLNNWQTNIVIPTMLLALKIA